MVYVSCEAQSRTDSESFEVDCLSSVDLEEKLHDVVSLSNDDVQLRLGEIDTLHGFVKQIVQFAFDE